MNYLLRHYNKVVLPDIVYKYQIKNTKIIPKINKVVLSAQFGTTYKGSIASFFEMVTFHKPVITQSYTNILSLDLRKGEPVGVKIVLRKQSIFDFLSYFLFEILPSVKKFDGLKIKLNCIHWQLKDIFDVDDTSYLHIYFADLSRFDIVIYGENLNSNFFLACRFPIKQKNKIG